MHKSLEVYQWLVPLIAIYYIIRTFRQYASGKYSPRNTIVWIFFWIGVMLLALLPDTIANSVARTLGFKDHINAIVFVALGLLFLMIFYLSSAVNRIEDRITDLVRKLALEKVEQNKIKNNMQLTIPKVARKYVSKKQSNKRKSK